MRVEEGFTGEKNLAPATVKPWILPHVRGRLLGLSIPRLTCGRMAGATAEFILAEHDAFSAQASGKNG
jgi:hypothetical protein